MSIDESIDMLDNDEDEIKERRPKPFRYLDNESEIQSELTNDDTTDFSVMKASEGIKITMNDERLTNLENAAKIEDIIKKHEIIRKQNMKDTEGYSIN